MAIRINRRVITLRLLFAAISLLWALDGHRQAHGRLQIHPMTNAKLESQSSHRSSQTYIFLPLRQDPGIPPMMAETLQLCPGPATGLGLCRAFLWVMEDVPLTVLYLGAGACLVWDSRRQCSGGSLCSPTARSLHDLSKRAPSPHGAVLQDRGALLTPVCAHGSFSCSGGLRTAPCGRNLGFFFFLEAYTGYLEWVEV